ncbi:unnamed protein product, partial [Symbiodinium pilosum]
SMIARISSLSRSHVIDLVLQFATEMDFLSRPELIEPYIEETVVPCRTAQELLAVAKVSPNE